MSLPSGVRTDRIVPSNGIDRPFIRMWSKSKTRASLPLTSCRRMTEPSSVALRYSLGLVTVIVNRSPSRAVRLSRSLYSRAVTTVPPRTDVGLAPYRLRSLYGARSSYGVRPLYDAQLGSADTR